MNPYQLQQMQQAALIASQHKNSLALHHHYSSHHNQHTQVQHPHQPSHTSSSSSTSSNSHSRPIVERGASWSYNETRILLSLWGQDMVQRQLTNSKRTRHVWEKIAERIREHGFERTADQVRTRVFNMIAEYRRILKNPSPERKKKCIFFDALHKIYQAKDTNGVKAALNNYEEDYNLDPIDFSMSDENHDHNVTDGEDGSGNENEEKEIFAYDMSPSAALANGHGTNGNTNLDPAGDTDSIGENEVEARPANGTGTSIYGHPCKRLRADSSLSNSLLNNSHPGNSQLHQSMYLNSGNSSSLDATASALLVDRMFNHLAKETEVMREWVQLERERLKDEVERRKSESEREERREAAFLSTLTRMQEQLFSYLSQSSVAKLEGATTGSGGGESASLVTTNGHGNFNCHSTSNGTESENQVNATSTSTSSNTVKDAGNNSSPNCNNKFTTNGRRMYDENFSSASPSGVSNNASEGEEEETQLPPTNDGSSSQLH